MVRNNSRCARGCGSQLLALNTFSPFAQAAESETKSSPFAEAHALLKSGAYKPRVLNSFVNPLRSEMRRKRRAEDPVWRERQNAKTREWYQKNKAKKMAANIAWRMRNPHAAEAIRAKAAEERKERAAAAQALKQLKQLKKKSKE